MAVELLISWGPLTVLLLSLAAHFGHLYRQRRLGRPSATAGPAGSAYAFVDEVLRRALVVMFLYFLYRALSPQSEHQFGWIGWLADETIRLAGLCLSFLGALWLFAVQILIGESWGIGVPARGLPWLVNAWPFTVSRNPVFVGIMAEASGLFLASPTALTLMAFIAIWFGIHVQVRIEEDYLRAAYGADYLSYCKRVRRWL